MKILKYSLKILILIDCILKIIFNRISNIYKRLLSNNYIKIDYNVKLNKA